MYEIKIRKCKSSLVILAAKYQDFSDEVPIKVGLRIGATEIVIGLWAESKYIYSY
jgi:hypothetical protein